MSSYDLGEIQRQIANLIRVGRIAELDEANARVKVASGGLTTDWLPWGASRAGTTRSVSMPSVGEQVVLFAPFGDTSQAVVGFSLFQDSSPAPSVDKAIEKTIYPDGSAVEYNSTSNTLTITISGAGNVVINCKNATINAETLVKLNAPETEITGHATIKNGLTIEGGTVTHDGVNIGKNHRHAGSPTAPAGPVSPTGIPQ